MKIQINADIIKNIPEKYKQAVELMPIWLWNEPKKIRLSKLERLMLAEYAWRMTLSKSYIEFLSGAELNSVVEETNRKGLIRYVSNYNCTDSFQLRAITTKSIAMLAWNCELLYEENKDW